MFVLFTFIPMHAMAAVTFSGLSNDIYSLTLLRTFNATHVRVCLHFERSGLNIYGKCITEYMVKLHTYMRSIFVHSLSLLYFYI